jgi:uncharacterized protein
VAAAQFSVAGLLRSPVLDTLHDLMGHPKVGASFEGFVIEQILAILRTRDASFWSTHQGAELDLLLLRGNARLGFEIQLADAPRLTRSMTIASDDLRLTSPFVVSMSARRHALARRIEVIPVRDLPALLATLV